MRSSPAFVPIQDTVYYGGTFVLGVLRDAHSRQSSPKWTPEGLLWEIPHVVDCERREHELGRSDAQPLYTLQVSAKCRKKNHFTWFSHHKKHLFFLARFLLERRSEYVEMGMRLIKNWLASDNAKAITNERDKMVHATHWAAWAALCQMLESHEPEETMAFSKFLWARAKQASQDVTSETNINIIIDESSDIFASLILFDWMTSHLNRYSPAMPCGRKRIMTMSNRPQDMGRILAATS